jgi:hypothetical protein
MKTIRERARQRIICAGLFCLFLVVVAIGWFSADGPSENSLLTGRWLLSIEGFPPARYLEFSSNGDVTCYKLDGVTPDSVPGYREHWAVRGNVIETIAQMGAPATPILTSAKEFVSQLFSSKPRSLPQPTRYAYTIIDDATLQLDLLGSPTPHCVILTRAPASDE